MYALRIAIRNARMAPMSIRRAMKRRHAFKTRKATPAGFQAIGAMPKYDYALYQPVDDRGGEHPQGDRVRRDGDG